MESAYHDKDRFLDLLGRPRHALRFAREWLAREPENSFALRCVGHALLLVGSFEESRSTLESSLSQRPEDDVVYYLMARTYFEEDRWDEADQLVDRALELDPTWSWTRSLKASLCIQKNDFREGLRRATEVFGEYPEESTFAGLVAAATGWVDCSSEEGARLRVEAYRVALALDPNDADFHEGLGDAFALLDRYDDAQRCYREALRLEPDSKTARRDFVGATIEGDGIMRVLNALSRWVDQYPESRRPKSAIRWVVWGFETLISGFVGLFLIVGLLCCALAAVLYRRVARWDATNRLDIELGGARVAHPWGPRVLRFGGGTLLIGAAIAAVGALALAMFWWTAFGWVVAGLCVVLSIVGVVTDLHEWRGPSTDGRETENSAKKVGGVGDASV